MVPVPETPAGALRQAFIDHGKTLDIEFMEVDRDTPLTDVSCNVMDGVDILAHSV